eukprot:gnl/Trimastix_PCT/4451.p1 GENE.gnl/Trimastix_PCT/4451~~gnl/Trimastix_PCT/4451.p1  ORF type:complete len:1061 (+),score=300.19 gnl/Trimastix_PCT/4451:61-3243(+)
MEEVILLQLQCDGFETGSPEIIEYVRARFADSLEPDQVYAKTRDWLEEKRMSIDAELAERLQEAPVTPARKEPERKQKPRDPSPSEVIPCAVIVEEKSEPDEIKPVPEVKRPKKPETTRELAFTPPRPRPSKGALHPRSPPPTPAPTPAPAPVPAPVPVPAPSPPREEEDEEVLAALGTPGAAVPVRTSTPGNGAAPSTGSSSPRSVPKKPRTRLPRLGLAIACGVGRSPIASCPAGELCVTETPSPLAAPLSGSPGAVSRPGSACATRLDAAGTPPTSSSDNLFASPLHLGSTSFGSASGPSPVKAAPASAPWTSPPSGSPVSAPTPPVSPADRVPATVPATVDEDASTEVEDNDLLEHKEKGSKASPDAAPMLKEPTNAEAEINEMQTVPDADAEPSVEMDLFPMLIGRKRLHTEISQDNKERSASPEAREGATITTRAKAASSPLLPTTPPKKEAKETEKNDDHKGDDDSQDTVSIDGDDEEDATAPLEEEEPIEKPLIRKKSASNRPCVASPSRAALRPKLTRVPTYYSLGACASPSPSGPEFSSPLLPIPMGQPDAAGATPTPEEPTPASPPAMTPTDTATSSLTTTATVTATATTTTRTHSSPTSDSATTTTTTTTSTTTPSPSSPPRETAPKLVDALLRRRPPPSPAPASSTPADSPERPGCLQRSLTDQDRLLALKLAQDDIKGIAQASTTDTDESADHAIALRMMQEFEAEAEQRRKQREEDSFLAVQIAEQLKEEEERKKRLDEDEAAARRLQEEIEREEEEEAAEEERRREEEERLARSRRGRRRGRRGAAAAAMWGAMPMAMPAASRKRKGKGGFGFDGPGAAEDTKEDEEAAKRESAVVLDREGIRVREESDDSILSRVELKMKKGGNAALLRSGTAKDLLVAMQLQEEYENEDKKTRERAKVLEQIDTRIAFFYQQGFDESEERKRRRTEGEGDAADDDEEAEEGLLPPQKEMMAMVLLNEMQTRAVRYVIEESIPLSERAYPTVLNKVLDLGFTESQLKRTLRYIRDEAPIIIHFNCDKVMQFFIKDTHYRNQFETAMSGGGLSL